MVPRLMFMPPEKKERIPLLCDIPFFKKQCSSYCATRESLTREITDTSPGWLSALEKVFTSMSPEAVVQEITLVRVERPRRCRFPHRREVEGMPRREEDAEVRDLQLR